MPNSGISKRIKALLQIDDTILRLFRAAAACRSGFSTEDTLRPEDRMLVAV